MSRNVFICNHDSPGPSYEEMRQNRKTRCQICGDVSKGVYYTATSCKSCMDFFRRCVIYKKQYKCIGITAKEKCIEQNNCILCRRRCRFCRFQECYKAGMRNELVLSRQKRNNTDTEREQNQNQPIHSNQRSNQLTYRTDDFDQRRTNSPKSPFNRSSTSRLEYYNSPGSSHQTMRSPNHNQDQSGISSNNSATESEMGFQIISISELDETLSPVDMSPSQQCLLDSITNFWRAYRYGPICPYETSSSNAVSSQLVDTRVYLTQQLAALKITNDFDTSDPVGKVLHLQTAFRNHISTLHILMNVIPEIQNMKRESLSAIVEGSWLCMKFLRGVPVVDKFDEKNLSYQGLSGQKYTLDFFLSAGLQMSTLRKVIQYTQKMKSLEPDVEEQALLAGISMFSPFLRNVRDHDDIHLLSKIQYTLTKILEKKLRRNPSRMIHFANFMLGITDLQVMGSEFRSEYDSFVNYTPKIVTLAPASFTPPSNALCPSS